MHRTSLLTAITTASLLLAAGCKKKAPPEATPGAADKAPAPAASSSAPARRRLPSPRRSGSVIARTVKSDLLLVADEDHSALRVAPLPLDQNGNESVELPGPPAQVLVRDGEAWVTVRDPGLVLCFAIEGKALREVARVEVPADAWGMGLSPDESKLLVTSPWSNSVTLIDVASRAVIKTLPTAREPRAALFTSDSRAYVTHLVGTALTRVDLGGEGPQSKAIPLTAGPLRAPFGAPAGASLAYSAALSPDGKRLFVPRHALGTYSTFFHVPWESEPGVAWFGTSAVDILQTSSDEPLAPGRTYPGYLGNFGNVRGIPEEAPKTTRSPSAPPTPFVQPRDVVYRASTKTLLVASEGTDRLVELNAMAIDPTLGVVHSYPTGARTDPKVGVATAGATPQGLALSDDEHTAWVFARGTYELVTIPLKEVSKTGAFRAAKAPMIDPRSTTYIRLAEDPLGPEASLGRRVFTNATDSIISGGLGCAGCHPEGRDDGFVWREIREKNPKEGEKPLPAVFVGHPSTLESPADEGRARQTPMLAGRVDADGPYGWHGQNKDVDERIAEGFRLHRWSARASNPKEAEHRIKALAAFLRKGGLRPPPREKRELTPEELKGKEIFSSEQTACASCHPADTGYTNRASVPLSSPLPTRAGFATDEDQAFKVPSLLFVKNTAPYYHDGSVQTLDELINKNADRMGKTNHLTADEKKALVAFLKTL